MKMKKNTDWPKAKIKRLAMTSGKPLEVTAAQAFLAKNWSARLGTHFDERNSVKGPRELDVLANRVALFPPNPSFPDRPMTCLVRALVSCKGFRADQSPLTYSSSVPAPAPLLLSNHRYARSTGPVADLERAGARLLLNNLKLSTSRPIVAFDVLQRKFEKSKAKNKVFPLYARSGDASVFEGADSALKAAFYWRRADVYYDRPFAALHVPVCVLSLPFWDVSIDGGVVGEPEIRTRGYQVLSYPSTYTGGAEQSEDPLVIVIHRDELPELVDVLEHLFDWFLGEIEKRGWR